MVNKNSVKKSKKSASSGLDNWGKQQVSLIEKIEETIRKYGWIQHQEGNVNQGFCLLGAKNHVEEQLGVTFESGLLNFTSDKIGDKSDFVVYNDSVAKSENDIYRLLREAKKNVKLFVKQRKLVKEAEELKKNKQKIENELEKLSVLSEKFINGYEFENENEFRVDY